MAVDIHRQERGLEKIIENIKSNDKILESNKNTILNFANNYLHNEGYTKARLKRYLHDLEKIGVFLENKPFLETTRKDIETVFNKFIAYGEETRGGYKQNTILDFKKTLKKFYKWLRQDEVTPPEVRWLKGGAVYDKELGKKILTQEEIKKLVETGQTDFERLLPLFLYESNCRIGEIFIKLSDISIEPERIIIKVSGKTGERWILLKYSKVYFEEYFNKHPDRHNPDALFWYGEKGYLTNYWTFNQCLRKLKKRAGITKPVNPHNFRKSFTSHHAHELPTSVLSSYGGWVEGSRALRCYIATNKEATIKKIDQTLYGGSREEVDPIQKNVLRTVTCPRCKTINPCSNSFCKCGQALSLEFSETDISKKTAREELKQEILEELLEMIRSGAKIKALPEHLQETKVL